METRIEHHADGKAIKAVYTVDRNGLKQGNYQSYYKNEQPCQKGAYSDGAETGLWEYYYENGQLWKVCTYRNGRKDGLYAAYYANGRLGEKCFYKNGKKDGPYISYRDDGRLDTKYVYKDGERLNDPQAKEYLKEWNKAHHPPQNIRKILKARLNQFGQQMHPCKLR